jgi:hypothetical protein
MRCDAATQRHGSIKLIKQHLSYYFCITVY